MNEVIRFLLKGWLKSKYIFILPVAITVLVGTMFVMNSMQSGATKQELQEMFNNRKDTVHLLITSTLTKERVIGLTPEEQQSLQSLLLKEQYINDILKKLAENDLQIVDQQLAYLNEYENYIAFKAIPYLGEHTVEVEREKAEALFDHQLGYTEQNTPFKTALFTKQLFHILFSPITAFLLLLAFCYQYMFDRENRTFDFFKINSLSSTAIYFGYLIPLLMVVLCYIALACAVSILPPLLTGNLNTIYYPVEVAMNSEIILVPIWKWLVFIPIGWGIFSALLLLLFTCLIKQQTRLGFLFALISVPVLISYMISLKTGFQRYNPIHLIVSYEQLLLNSNRFVLYLIIMLLLAVVCTGLTYTVINLQNISFGLPDYTASKKQYQPNRKFKLLQFEYLKKRRKGHILMTVLLLFGIIGGTVIAVNEQYRTYPDKALKVIESAQNTIIQDHVHWKMVSDEFEMEQELHRQMAEETGEELELLDQNPYQSMIIQLEMRFVALEHLKGDIQSPTFAETFRDVMSSFEPGSYKESDNTLWTLTDMASEEQEILLDDKRIDPWPIGHKWVSNFDDPSQALDQEHYERLKLYQEQNTKYGDSSTFAMYRLVEWNIMLIVLFFFIFLLWTTMADEYRPNPSMNFLATKPIRFSSIYIMKWIYNLTISCSLLLITGTVVFLIATFIGGVGDGDYPVLIYATEQMEEHFFFSNANNAYFYFESLTSLLLKSGVLVFMQLFFLNSLFSFVGKLMKNHYAAIIVTSLLVIAGYFAGNHYIELSSSMYNPFVYFDTWNIVDGWKSIEANNGKVNFLTGTVILLISGSLLFFVGLLVKRKVTS
ncbi:hypothetical protein MKX73_14395 [Solibacillus sp. FSL W7-1436]|uniref:hypothetical protein n=1 Tax=Solibacillus sp. FSL W7-1436 TaxID=2921705 RepID=UPI0030F5928D